MKRKYYLLALIILGCTTFVQAEPFTKGTKQLNIGLGAIPSWGLNASFDYGLVDTWGPGIFTIGGYLGYAQGGTETYFLHDYNDNYVSLLSRATYRYSFTDQFEVYGGVMAGVVFWWYEAGNYNYKSQTFVITPTVGCRYSFSQKFGVYAESNFDGYTNFLNAGIALQF